jgi:ribosomal protein L21
VGTQICIDEVLMIGTKDYTAIGRPKVSAAKVFATVEEIT